MYKLDLIHLPDPNTQDFLGRGGGESVFILLLFARTREHQANSNNKKIKQIIFGNHYDLQ